MSDTKRAERILETIGRVVPQCFSSEHGGDHPHRLNLKGVSKCFYSTRGLPRPLLNLLSFANANAEKWYDTLPQILTRSALSRIGEDMAVYWLESHGSVAWRELLAYFEDVRARTSENSAVALNLIVSEGAVGGPDIRQDELQKILDSMAGSPNTFVRVNPQLEFLEFGEVQWSDIRAEGDYKYNPEFLQPMKSILRENEFSAHLTTRGDIVVMNKWGILASSRKGAWHSYQADAMKNALVDAFGKVYRVGCNMFELALDLSYRRHGGLLVFDPEHKAINAIANDDSRLVREAGIAPSDRQALFEVVRAAPMGNSQIFSTIKRRLVELASLDGAVIFDEKEVLAIGAMISHHPDVGNHFGARETAAHSALRWGGRPMKVSADGDIMILFWHQYRGTRSIAKLHYL